MLKRRGLRPVRGSTSLYSGFLPSRVTAALVSTDRQSAISTSLRCWDLSRRLRNEAELRYGQAFRTRSRSCRRSSPQCSAGRLRPESWRPPRSWESSGARTYDGRSYTASRVLTALASGLAALAVCARQSADALSVSPRQRLWPLCSRRLWIPRSLRSLAVSDSRIRLKDTFRELLPIALAAVPLYAPVVAFLAFAYEQISPFTLPLFLVPALAAQRFFGLYQGQRVLTEELVEMNTTLERANLSFASALVAALDARDRYTAGHSSAVAVYARDIAAQDGAIASATATGQPLWACS